MNKNHLFTLTAKNQTLNTAIHSHPYHKMPRFSKFKVVLTEINFYKNKLTTRVKFNPKESNHSLKK